jgi:hypothetical protein
MLDYFAKLTELPPIKALRNPLKPALMAIFLATPLVSAWAWHDRQNEPPETREEAPMTQRLPVEIITSDTQPKWVLVPIDPG